MTESIGMRLRRAREMRQLSLQQVSDTTKVRAHYLQALESDDLSAIPSAAQARGFLRIYTDFLGLQVADLIPQTPAAPARAATAEPQTQPNPAAPRHLTEASASVAGPSLLDRARSLLGRLAQARTTTADVHPASASEGPAESSAAAAPNSPSQPTKKKVKS